MFVVPLTLCLVCDWFDRISTFYSNTADSLETLQFRISARMKLGSEYKTFKKLMAEPRSSTFIKQCLVASLIRASALSKSQLTDMIALLLASIFYVTVVILRFEFVRC